MARISKLHVNGKMLDTDADGSRPLLSILRDDLALTGSHYGCGENQCGACTVWIDGEARRSCTLRVSSAEGHSITTIEALAQDGRLHPVQQAFLDHEAFQCGYCTPGMIMGAVAFLKRNPNPSRAEIVRGMNAHLCRCGTYHRIVAAIEDAAAKMREAKS